MGVITAPRRICFCLAVVLMMSLIFANPGSVMGVESDLEVDIESLQGESGSVTLRDGYPEALYPEGAYVLQFAGGCGYISLGNMDLSKYSEVVLNVGSSASAVFSNATGKAYLALTSNGAVATGNKNEGITPIDTADILARKTLSAPAGRWASGEQIVRIPIDSSYSGNVFLAYGPIIRDNNGSPTLDAIVVSKITFKKASVQVKPPVEQWQDIADMELSSFIDFEDEDPFTDGNALGEFNTYWGVERGQYFTTYQKEDGTIGGKVDDTNYFQAQYLDITESQAYVFSFDAQLGSSQFYFYVRGTEPVIRDNPAWKQAAIGWYEKDWYTENGGLASGAVSTMGASGVALTKGNSDSTLALVIKTYEQDGIHIASRVVNIPVDQEIATGIHSYTIYDDGNGTIKYYLDGGLFATVAYSEPTQYDDEWDDTLYNFYKNVTVRDAYGTVLGTVENSRLSEEGTIAFAFRKMNGTINLVDNLKVSMAKEPENPVATPTNTPVTTPEAQTPTQGPSEPASTSQVKPEARTGNGWIWIVVCLGVAILAGLVIVVIVKHKTKKS